MRWVLHVDLDMFLAAVEILRKPELAGKPVVVGGRGIVNERAVVSTASYEAREFGIRSGMPLRTAYKKCPDAVFLPVDAPHYLAASAEVMAALRDLEWGGVPVVLEVLGWDEAFLGPGEGHGDLGDPWDMAMVVRSAVLERTRLHCSVGIGNNKLQAKIATDFGKPSHVRGGTYAITDETWYDEMGARPTRALWGIGAKIAGRLSALGIETVTDLATSDTELLVGEFGPTMGPWFHRMGRGVDTSPVDATPWVARAHGREETFQQDLTWDEVPGAVRTLAARVVEDIDREGRPAMRVFLKIRYRNFFTLTRSRKLKEPTNDPEALGDVAVALLEKVEPDKPVRLLGVRYEMVPPEGGYERCTLVEEVALRRRTVVRDGLTPSSTTGEHVEPRAGRAVVRRVATADESDQAVARGAGGGDDLGRVAERDLVLGELVLVVDPDPAVELAHHVEVEVAGREGRARPDGWDGDVDVHGQRAARSVERGQPATLRRGPRQGRNEAELVGRGDVLGAGTGHVRAAREPQPGAVLVVAEVDARERPVRAVAPLGHPDVDGVPEREGHGRIRVARRATTSW